MLNTDTLLVCPGNTVVFLRICVSVGHFDQQILFSPLDTLANNFVSGHRCVSAFLIKTHSARQKLLPGGRAKKVKKYGRSKFGF